MNLPRKAPVFEALTVAGPAGQLEVLRLESALPETRGIALVAHPNPLEGGTNTNKIVHTLAKTLSRLGYVAYCPNLRGVGRSEGEHSRGVYEPDDMAAVLAQARVDFPGVTRVVLSGFSFGTFVQSQLRQRLSDAEVEGMILIGPATIRHQFPPGAGRYIGDPRRAGRSGATAISVRLGPAAATTGAGGARRWPFLPWSAYPTGRSGRSRMA